jgi:hypothetical protein
MFIRSIDGIVFKPGKFEYVALEDRESSASESEDLSEDEESITSEADLQLQAEEIDEDDSNV